MKTEPNTEPDPYLRAFIDAIAERDRLKAINKELLDALRKIRDFGDNEVYPYNQTIEIARTAIKKAEAL